MKSKKKDGNEKGKVLAHVLSREEISRVAGGTRETLMVKKCTTNQWTDDGTCTPTVDN